MYTQTLKILILLGLPVMAQAQDNMAPFQAARRPILLRTPALPTAKVTAGDPITGLAHYTYSAGTARINDSSAFTWAGGRTSVQSDMGSVTITDFDQKQAFINSGGSMLPTVKINNTYNTAGKVINTVQQKWLSSSGIWVNELRVNYTYTGTKTVALQDNWNSGSSSWVNTFRFTTDSSAGVKDEWYERWGGSSWVNMSHYQFQYSGANLIDFITQEWKSGAWQNTRRETDTYSGSNPTERITQLWNTSSATWENKYRTGIIYPAGSSLSSEYINYNWNSSTAGWDNSFRGLNTWTAGKLTGQTDQAWDATAGAWQDIGKSTYTYNSAGSLLVYHVERWEYISMSWEDNYRYEYDYNSSNALTRDLFSEKGTAASLQKKTENFYYYNTTTGIPENKEALRNIRLYPNPSLYAQVYVDYATLTADETSIVLTDLNGKVLYHHSEAGSIGDHSVKIPVADLAKGIYLVQVYSNDKQVQTLKLNK